MDAGVSCLPFVAACFWLWPYLYLGSLHISPEAKCNPSHGEQPQGLEGPAKLPGRVHLGKAVPKLAQRVGQVRGRALGDNGRFIQVFGNNVHPEPDPSLGAAKANDAVPVGGHALGDHGWFLQVFGNHVQTGRWLLQVFRKVFYPDYDAAKAKVTGEDRRQAESYLEGENQAEPHRSLSGGYGSQHAQATVPQVQPGKGLVPA